MQTAYVIFHVPVGRAFASMHKQNECRQSLPLKLIPSPSYNTLESVVEYLRMKGQLNKHSAPMPQFPQKFYED